jgi:hypothetical protein
MNDPGSKNQLPPRTWHGAHQSWNYRPHAFRWIGEQIVGINFMPLARDMRAWLMRRGQLTLASTADQQTAGGYTNPYTFSGVSLTLNHMDLVNKRRITHAAHSGIQTLNIRTVEDSKAQLLRDCDEVLTAFLHMLSHLEKLEVSILDDLAQKGEAIVLLRLNGLPPEDCNFDLSPGERFAHEPKPSPRKVGQPG